MTARTVRVTGALVTSQPVTFRPDAAEPAQRGDGDLGDALIAMGYRVGERFDAALTGALILASGYVFAPVAVALVRWLL